MRTIEIESTTVFKWDYKRTKATPRYREIETLLSEIIHLLGTDQPLQPKYRDHSLGGTGKTIASAT